MFLLTIDTSQYVDMPQSGFIRSIFIISLCVWFFVETMKIKWTGTYHKEDIKYHSCETSDVKHDLNGNIISNNDIIFDMQNVL